LDKNLVISNTKGFDVVKMSDIILCQADGYCTNFIIRGKTRISSSRNLKYYEELLPTTSFMRVHHSYIINIECVTGYSNQEVIVLTEENSCPVSASHKQEFLKMFKNGRKF
jgi:two-component system LytT family response regulator